MSIFLLRTLFIYSYSTCEFNLGVFVCLVDALGLRYYSQLASSIVAHMCNYSLVILTCELSGAKANTCMFE